MSWEDDLDRLVTERGSALVAYAYLLTGDMSAAEDLVQDALVRTYSRRRPEESPGSRPTCGGSSCTPTSTATGHDAASPPSRHLVATPEAADDEAAAAGDRADVAPGAHRPVPPRARLRRPAVLRRPHAARDRPAARGLPRGREALPVRRPAQARTAARPAAGPVHRGRHHDHEGSRAMNRDLESALGELADRAEQSHRAGRAPLPVDRITARARRHRRRTRAAVAIGGAAAAVVIVAGTAFARPPGPHSPAPPATRRPRPSRRRPRRPRTTPTRPRPSRRSCCPSATPRCRSAPAARWRTPAPAYPVDDRVVARVVPDAATLASGGFLAAGGEVDRSPESAAFLAYAVPDGGPRVAVVRDGVVVGTAGFSPGPTT